MNAQGRLRRFLVTRGAPDFVVEAGLAGLVRRWKESARAVHRGYPLGLEDYLNDLDVRQLIAESLPLTTPAERKKARSRVIEADTVFKQHSKATRICLWGTREAARRGWTSRKNWWYYRLPLHPGESLRSDLIDRGI
jgi:hypothetical protein